MFDLSVHSDETSQAPLAADRVSLNRPVEGATATPEGAARRFAVNPTALFNRCVAIAILLFAWPLLLVISLALLVTQGPRIFYAGERLGKNKSIFKIYKFRTLDDAKAAKLTRDRVLPNGSNIETPLGRYLRKSRLDELPQIFNLLKGDMDIIGPRPVRSVIAAAEEASNPNYAIRFQQKPGFVGFTQAYYSHGTSKRIRSKLNYRVCRKKLPLITSVGFLVRVGVNVLAKSLRLVAEKLLPSFKDASARRRLRAWQLVLETKHGDLEVKALDATTLVTAQGFVSGPVTLNLVTATGGMRRFAVDLCLVSVDRHGTCYTYVPKNDVAKYYVDRYLLDEPVIAPRPNWSMPTQALAATDRRSFIPGFPVLQAKKP